jgi:murein DD-endopeptidase MepM/ murein hydrolase activator NlpD
MINRLTVVFLSVLLVFLLSCEVFADGREPLTINLSSNKLFQGDVALVSVADANSLSSAQLFWKEKRIPLVRLEEKGVFAAFFAVPQNEQAGPKKFHVEFVYADGQRSARSLSFKVESKKFPVQHLTLPKEKVTLSKKDLARHQREKAAIKKALAHPLETRVWQSSFRRPVQGEVSTSFGVRRILNGKPRSSHSGIDLRGREGEPVAAPSDGVVILTGEHFFAGKSVYIDHGMGIITMYFHLSDIRVKKGDRVHSRQTIGLVGSTGRSTGPHLHWGLRVHDRPADPLTFLALFPLH